MLWSDFIFEGIVLERLVGLGLETCRFTFEWIDEHLVVCFGESLIPSEKERMYPNCAKNVCVSDGAVSQKWTKKLENSCVHQRVR